MHCFGKLITTILQAQSLPTAGQMTIHRRNMCRVLLSDEGTPQVISPKTLETIDGAKAHMGYTWVFLQCGVDPVSCSSFNRGSWADISRRSRARAFASRALSKGHVEICRAPAPNPKVHSFHPWLVVGLAHLCPHILNHTETSCVVAILLVLASFAGKVSICSARPVAKNILGVTSQTTHDPPAPVGVASLHICCIRGG